MLRSDEKNDLLQQLKAAIEEIIAANQATNVSAITITDKLRHDILKILVSYSDKIPHPASPPINIERAL